MPNSSIVLTPLEVVRAAIMSVVTNGASMLVLLHLVDLDASQLAGITTFASSVIVLVFLFWKPKTLPEIDYEQLVQELIRQHALAAPTSPTTG